MTLDEIEALEYEWMASRWNEPSVRDRHAHFQRTGVYEASQSVFKEYVSLARQGNTEALKRALFLYWFSWAEPNELSGILGLDHDLARKVLGMVDDRARTGSLDEELDWMLGYYYMVYPLYLDHIDPTRSQFPYLRKASEEDEAEHTPGERCLSFSYDGRGLLGEYWRRLQNYDWRWSSEDAGEPEPDEG